MLKLRAIDIAEHFSRPDFDLFPFLAQWDLCELVPNQRTLEEMEPDLPWEPFGRGLPV
jgi:hypothetical protein